MRSTDPARVGVPASDGASVWLLVDPSCSGCASSSGRNDTNALTKPVELNLGRQIGSQDAEADELRIDGECTVLSRMCRSSVQHSDHGMREAEPMQKGFTRRVYRMLARPREGDNVSIRNKDNIEEVPHLRCRNQRIRHLLAEGRVHLEAA